ncbi:unnamed protein product, partial [Rhizoctonia solani]
MQGNDGPIPTLVNGHPPMLKRTRSDSRSGPTLTPSSTRSNTTIRPGILGQIEPPHSSDAEPLSSDAEQASPTKAPSVIELSSDSDDPEVIPRPIKHHSHNTFPGREVIEIESSDEEPMPSLPIPRQSSSANNPLRPYYAGGSSSITTPRSSSSGTTLYHQAPASFPVQRGHSQMSSVQNRSRVSTPESVGSYASSARKRSIQHTDGEADESNDEQLGYSSMDADDREERISKRARYGMLPETGEVDGGDEEEYHAGGGDYMPQQPAGRDRADTIMPGHFDLDFIAPAPVPYPENALYGTDVYSNGYQPYNIFNDNLLMPAATGSSMTHPSMGYHAPPMGTTMPAPQAMTSDSLNRLNHGFKLNYDDQSPVTWLDTAGPNHALQLQKFFEDAMDDHEGAIPVRDAAKSLGLLSTTERLQGMQVPLMPHQLIGVAWMVKQELGMVGGGILADDMGL